MNNTEVYVKYKESEKEAWLKVRMGRVVEADYNRASLIGYKWRAVEKTLFKKYPNAVFRFIEPKSYFDTDEFKEWEEQFKTVYLPLYNQYCTPILEKYGSLFMNTNYFRELTKLLRKGDLVAIKAHLIDRPTKEDMEVNMQVISVSETIELMELENYPLYVSYCSHIIKEKGVLFYRTYYFKRLIEIIKEGNEELLVTHLKEDIALYTK